MVRFGRGDGLPRVAMFDSVCKADAGMKRLSPDEAVELLAGRLRAVDSERITPTVGRVLAEAVVADRDSPAADVSAMDGYAVRMADLRNRESVAVVGEVQPGTPPAELPVGAAMRIFTGAVIPTGAEIVVKREDTSESPDRVDWSNVARRLDMGSNIRRQGENGRSGDEILRAGTPLTAASIAAAANFGAAEVAVYSRVVCSVIVTGNELLAVHESPRPWQLRDSNGPTVGAMIDGQPWLVRGHHNRCGDDRDRLRERLETALADSDAVILTGGVSKGDYDHVPGVIEAVGGEIVFHRLPIRPGQPVLGAVTRQGKLILGLPGNPVSTACCMLRIGMPLLKVLGGHRVIGHRPVAVAIQPGDDKTLPLHWMRLVRLTGDTRDDGVSTAAYVASQGSGDLVGLAQSDWFVELPPGESGPGPWPFYAW
jgi:molybdopterin molybdotransferase